MKLEINLRCVDPTTNLAKIGLLVTPPINEDYWMFKVQLSKKQAIVGFPKMFTIGIGFQYEEDWNTNLPYICEATEIFKHISHNKGDPSISDESCIAAIQLIKDVAEKYMEFKTGGKNETTIKTKEVGRSSSEGKRRT